MRGPSDGSNYRGSSGFTGSGQGSADRGASAPLSRLSQWIQENAVDHILLPAVFLVLRASFFLLTSVGLYTLLYFYLMPRALVKEPIYFDYSTSPPIATLNLFSAHKQWEYVSGGLKAGTILDDGSSSGASSSQFLRSDFAYSLDVGFTLAKSQRNFELGKFMSTMSLIDNTGDLIAKSSRPVVMPYQSAVTLFLDSVSKFPCRIVGLCSPNEDVTVHVPMMTEYREPKTSATESIELTLSSDKADIGTVEVTIMPVLRGVVFFMWYYPMLTAFTSVSCFMGIQLAIYGVYVLIQIVFKYLSEVEEDNNEDAGARSTEEGNDSTSITSIIETDGAQETESSQKAETAPYSSTQNSEGLYSLEEDSDSVGSEVSGSMVATDQDQGEHEIEAVLISESSTDNPNLRRRGQPS